VRLSAGRTMGASVVFHAYGYARYAQNAATSAYLLDAFKAIPQAQLLLVIDAMRVNLPVTCAHLDTWLGTLNATIDEAQRIHDNNA
jgi:hypothetical protein